MYEDQDEEVEEEEEFHEVEEEKHKTSQESVGSSSGDRIVLTSNKILESSNVMQENSSKNLEGRTASKEGKCKILKDNSETEQLELSEVPSETVALTNSNPDQSPLLASNPKPSEPELAENKDDSDEVVETCKVVERTDPTYSGKTSNNDVEQLVNEHVVAASSREPTPTPATDWANIMLNSEPKSTEKDETLESKVKNEEPEQGVDDIIRQTQDLKLTNNSVAIDKSIDLSSAEPDDLKETLVSVETTENCVEKVGAEDAVTIDADLVSGVERESKDDATKKELDLDEDEDKPQYIPKKGDFYEHDDRSHNVEDDAANKKENDDGASKDANACKRSQGQDKQGDNRRSSRRQRIDADRWNHDLFRDEKQKLKNNTPHGVESRQQDRTVRNQGDRSTRSTITSDRPQGSQDNRSRQGRDGRIQRQNQSGNRSRERRPRRQNVRNGNRTETVQSSSRNRDTNRDSRSRPDVKDSKDASDEKQSSQQMSLQVTSFSSPRRDHDSRDFRSARNDSRGRRRPSRDRPTNALDDDLPPPNTVMPPITTWSNEDMVKAEAFRKDSPSRQQSNSANNPPNINRNRPNEFWSSQGQTSKGGSYQDRPIRNHDENRHQSYNTRGRYQERGDDVHRMNHFTPRNQFNDRPNHGSNEWHRGSNFNSYGKSNDYIVKTQTFENSRLAQANKSNSRDLRDVLNERRMQGQQQFQPKAPQGVDQLSQSRSQMYHQHTGQQHLVHQQQMMSHQVPQHVLQQQHQHQQQQQQQQQQQHQQMQPQSQLHSHQLSPAQHQSQQQHQQPIRNNQLQLSKQSGAQLHHPSTRLGPQQASHQSQPPTQRQVGPQANQSRLNPISDSSTDHQENVRQDAGVSNDSLNSRPIIKTDTYTSTTSVVPPVTHQPASQHHMSQHSQNHRPVSGAGSIAQQQGPSTASSHMVASHMSTTGAVQTQYYSPTNNNARDPASAAALAAAYHSSYMPSGHTVMDSAARYHMTSQQMSDHGYMTSPGQAGDVSTGAVLHQQAMYADTAAGGTVASSAYMAQAGSTLSPSSNIPVTGSGGPQPLAPVSYLQHTQYPPPPYSNLYPQHQHNQAPPPPHSGQAYPPYWTYI